MTTTRHLTVDRATIIVDGVPLEPSIDELEQVDVDTETDPRGSYMQSIADAWKTPAASHEEDV